MAENKPICTAYQRADGQKGIRNKALVMYTVECSKHAAEQIARHFQLAGEDVDCVGSLTCVDNQVIIRRMLRFSIHPNVGAVLVVGHGCEYIDPEKIAAFAESHGRLAQSFFLQKIGGTQAGIAHGIKTVEQMLDKLRETPRCPLYAADLVIGAKCGGSDFTSGLTGNLLVGHFFEELIGRQGTGMIEEMAEAVGLKEYLVSRCVDEQAARDIAMTYDKTMDFCRKLGRYSISPGNFVGGLTTIEEKSMGAVVKSGNCPIEGVLKIAQAPKHKGFWLLDVIPDYTLDAAFFQGGDTTGLLDQIACGCHLVLFVTGRGHVGGTSISPVLKITGNGMTYRALEGDIDLDASPLLTGEKDMSGMLRELWEKVAAVCGGERCKAERTGHKEGTLFFNNQDSQKVIRHQF